MMLTELARQLPDDMENVRLRVVNVSVRCVVDEDRRELWVSVLLTDGSVRTYVLDPPDHMTPDDVVAYLMQRAHMAALLAV